MKKFFGILFILIGLLMIIGGIAAASSGVTRGNSYEGQFGDSTGSENNQELAMGGAAVAFVGLIFLIIGIVMTASKSSSQRKKEAELAVLRNMSSNANQVSVFNHQGNSLNTKLFDELSKQSHKMYEQKDYASAIGILRRMNDLSPTDSQIYFNLACCLSLSENKEGLEALSKAVEYGYTNIEKVKSYQALAWLRELPEYDSFLKNGFKYTASESTVNAPFNISNEGVINDQVIAQLEKLGKLKEQGLITDEEFQQQKKKILG